jgi:hypothetical protein
MFSAWQRRADGRPHIGLSMSRERTLHHQRSPLRSNRTRVCPLENKVVSRSRSIPTPMAIAGEQPSRLKRPNRSCYARRRDEVPGSASLNLGKLEHILRPYHTWKSPLAMPEAGDDTATYMDASLDVIVYIAKDTVFLLHIADVFCDLLSGFEAAAKGHATVSLQTLSGGRRYVCESSNGGWLIFWYKGPNLGGSTTGPRPPLRDIVPCRHRAAAFLTVSGSSWSSSHMLPKVVGFGGVEMPGQ